MEITIKTNQLLLITGGTLRCARQIRDTFALDTYVARFGVDFHEESTKKHILMLFTFFPQKVLLFISVIKHCEKYFFQF